MTKLVAISIVIESKFEIDTLAVAFDPHLIIYLLSQTARTKPPRISNRPTLKSQICSIGMRARLPREEDINHTKHSERTTY